jgi:uncharacterized protein YegL
MSGLLLFILISLTIASASEAAAAAQAKEERVIFLLDVSGSMSGQVANMVKGVNEQLESMEKTYRSLVPDTSVPFYVLIYTFSVERKLLLESTLAASPRITEEQYQIDGFTSLYDALLDTLEKDATPGSTIVIATDGQDNASRRADAASIKKLLNKTKTEKEVEVIYIAQGEEAWAQFDGLGITGPQGIPGPQGTPMGTIFASPAAVHTVGVASFRHLTTADIPAVKIEEL